MSQDQPNSKPDQTRKRVAGVIGGGLGVAASLAIGKWIGIESFWLGVVLVAACTGIGGLLAQMIASKIRVFPS